MQDLLKSIGIPTAIATSIALVVVIIPILFQVDERYAKQSDLESAVKKLERANRALAEQNSELRAELAQNTGFQQAMIGLISQGRAPALPLPVVVAAPPPPPSPPAPDLSVELAPPAAGLARPAKPAASAAPPVIVAPPAVERPPLEKPRNWRELNEAVTRQQQRLIIEK